MVNAAAPAFRADIGIRDGLIAAFIEPGDRAKSDAVLSAEGRVVLPGLIDPHVHAGVYRPLDEDLRDLTAFGLRGGITSMVAIQRRPSPYSELIPSAIHAFTESSLVDFGLIIGITSLEQIATIGDAVADHGIGAFKFYLGYRGNESRFGSDFTFSDDRLAEIMAALAGIPSDPLLAVHCENAELARYFREQAVHAGMASLALYEAASDVVTEMDAVARVTMLADRFNVRVAVLHVSAGSTAELLGRAPWIRRSRVVIETCPHYLAMDVEDPAGTRAVVRPPIRRRDEVERLWVQLAKGVIDTIGSDHCGNDLEDKAEKGVFECPLGFGESGFTLPILLSEGYHRRGLSLARIVALTSANAAQAHRLFPRKGTLRLGSDADLVVVDLEEERTLDADLITQFKGRPDGSIYAGRTLRGWPVATVRAGRVASLNAELQAGLPSARFLRGAPAYWARVHP